MFLLLLSKNFWILLCRRSFWRQTWFALFRFYKDPRAWGQLETALRYIATLVFTVSLIISMVVLMVSQDGGDSTAFGALGVLEVGSVATYLLLTLIAMGTNKRAPAATASQTWLDESLYRPAIRKKIAELALTYAVLLDRAGSEQFLAVKTLPEGVEVITRRNHVALLREHGLWDRLGSDEKELLMRPDGGWEAGTANRVADQLLEPLRVLRWVLQVDGFLPTVGQDPTPNFEIAKDVILEARKVLSGYDLVSRAGLETARNAAHVYFQRCAAEGVVRGYFQPESEANLMWSKDVAQRMAGQEGEDLVVESTIVSKLDEATIRYVTVQSLRRFRICDRLIKVISGKEALSETLTVV